MIFSSLFEKKAMNYFIIILVVSFFFLFFVIPACYNLKNEVNNII